MTTLQAQARDVFLSAIEQDSTDDLTRFLDARCGERTDLRAAVERLLQSHRALGAFHENAIEASEGTIQTPPPAPSHPDQVGPYRIIEELGQGGMGTVYLAEQKKPLRRTVALKLIKRGMDTDQFIARFEAERKRWR